MLRRFLISLGFLFALSAPAWAINCAVANGTCFWFGGTGTLDLATDSGHWGNATGGPTCSCEPISSNILTFDGSSGAGTVTVAIGGGTLTAGGITMSAFTGTLDFAANDNNVHISGATSAGFLNSGAATRTVSMGDGTWTVDSTGGNPWLVGGAGLTFNQNAFTLVMNLTGVTSQNATLGAFTYNAVTINGSTSYWPVPIIGAATITTLNLGAGGSYAFVGSTTYTITTLNIADGSSLAALTQVTSNTYGTAATLSIGNASTPAWAAFRDITKTGAGSITATNSLNLGHNTSVTITAPTTGGSSGGGIIGG